jgi:hypothetical protein
MSGAAEGYQSGRCRNSGSERAEGGNGQQKRIRKDNIGTEIKTIIELKGEEMKGRKENRGK